MSTMYWVRHGQARFLTEDYDRLSDLGRAQSRLLGEYWVQEGVQIDRVWTGTLLRQRDTASEAASAASAAGAQWPEPQSLSDLDEYPLEEIQAVIAPQLAEEDSGFAARMAELGEATEHRARSRLTQLVLESVMDAWIAGRYDAPELTTWASFSGGVVASFREIARAAPKSSTSVVVTSGGPIGVAVQSVLRAPDLEAAHLNWRVYNASFTRFTFSGTRVSLDQFNAIPHLTSAETRSYR